MRVDAQFALEVSYCTEKGIPHSQFLKWKPEDRSKALAWKMEEAETCQLCGTSRWQWEEDPYAFEPQEVWCKGCYYKDSNDQIKDNLPGTTIRLIPKAEAERIQGELDADGWRGR